MAEGGSACHINVPQRFQGGAFANAFRILQGSGGDILVDFCVYSERSNEATVVARLRVHHSLLQQLRDRLAESLREITISPSLVRGPLSS